MKVYVEFEVADTLHFAFYDTVEDRFESFNESQAWTTWLDFAKDTKYSNSNLERFRQLCPERFKE